MTTKEQPGIRRFHNQCVLVTGGASGIGAATVKRLSAEGAFPIVLDMNAEGAQRVADECGGVALAGDATSQALLTEAVGLATEKFGGLDALVTCAGNAVGGGAEMIEIDVWHKQLNLHLDGALVATKAALPAMRAKGGGAIVLVSSMGAYQSCPGQIAYSTAKAGLLAMVRSIAIDHGPENIRCNAICPGLITSPMTEKNFTELGKVVGMSFEETRKKMVNLVPLKRWAESSEIAASIAYLASSDSSYMTGNALIVDGGATIVEPGLTNVLSDSLWGVSH
jgi:NAD(P)-dependent dehydrogenase (short-subunit alcohol dehydrogenase family)